MRLFHAIPMMLALVVYNPTSPEGTGDNQRNVVEQQTKAKDTAVFAPNPKPDSKKCETKKQDGSENPHDWLYIAYLVSGPVVGILALFTAVVVWKQIATLRQIERAWVMIDISPRFFADGTLGADLTFVNRGKTPAWVHGIWLKWNWVDRVPNKPDYDGLTESLKTPRPIAPNESLDASSRFNTREPTAKTAIIYGVLRYRDIFRQERKTCFGCYLTGDRILTRLPSNFNEYT
jgi:hypothetical protein